MYTGFVVLFIISAHWLVSVDSGRAMTTLYTIKKFDFKFNKDFARDVTAFYLPVRGKWGRVGINLTVVKDIQSFLMIFNTFRQDEYDKNVFNPMALQFRVNICDIAKEGANGAVFRFFGGIYESFAEFFHTCPIAAGTQMVFAEREFQRVPRKGQGPFIPSGNYRFTFDFRNEQNISLALVTVEILYRGF